MKRIVRAPAKINLGLDTPHAYARGVLEWKMVMISVDLADDLQIETTSANSHIQVFSDKGFLPEGNRNLAYRAARVFKHAAHIDDGITIHIQKRIPVSAGLGGGSSDAAAVLRTLNDMYQTNFSDRQLEELGLKIDSDVPYCVYGKPALVTGKGDQITPLQPLPACWLVIAKPGVSISTLKLLRSVKHDELSHPNIDALIAAIQTGNYEQMVANMGNALEAVAAKNHPEVNILKERMLKAGADGAQMSGSGPTVFGICRQLSRAKRVYNSISGFCREVYLVAPVGEGA